jgi:hypothetical protein
LALSLGQLCQFIQQYFVVRNPFLNQPDKPLFINDIGDPSASEQTSYLALLVGNQGVGNPIEFSEFPVGVKTVSTDAQNLGIELFKTGNISLKSLQLARSDRGKVSEIECQDNMLFPQNIAEVNGALRRFSGEQRYRLTDLQSMGTE